MHVRAQALEQQRGSTSALHLSGAASTSAGPPPAPLQLQQPPHAQVHPSTSLGLGLGSSALHLGPTPEQQLLLHQHQLSAGGSFAPTPTAALSFANMAGSLVDDTYLKTRLVQVESQKHTVCSVAHRSPACFRFGTSSSASASARFSTCETACISCLARTRSRRTQAKA